MFLFNGKRPSIAAGLAGLLALGVSAGVPAVAFADEVMAIDSDAEGVGSNLQQGLAGDALAGQDAFTSLQQGDACGGESSGIGGVAPEGSHPEGPRDDAPAGPTESREEDSESGGEVDDLDGASDSTGDVDHDDVLDDDSSVPEIAPSEEGVTVDESGVTGSEEKEAPQNTWVKGTDGSYRYYGNDGKVFQDGWVTTDVLPDGEKGEKRHYWVSGGKLQESGWVITALGFDNMVDALQRYWIDKAIKALAGEGVYQTGSDSWTYVTDKGYVLRGVHKSGNKVYLADNDGRLAGGSKGGWVVSDKYGQGLQRYWIDAKEHAAISGKKTAGGWTHYTTSSGYVLRGADKAVRLFADNDGRLAANKWVVTDQFGQGLQRYWFGRDSEMARARLVDPGKESSGWWAYALSDGRILRGAYKLGNKVYLGDNDGRLAGGAKDGWVISDKYGQGLQRYWIDASEHAAIIGLSSDGWAHYTTDKGYVLRGHLKVGNKVYLGDNDGRLAGGAKDGWVISDKYGQGLQRYWIDASEHAAIIGFSTDGWAHCTTDAGYVLRGYGTIQGIRRYADNDGRLKKNGWMVTSNFGQGLQRYWFENYRVAPEGFYKTSDSSYTYVTNKGYVLRSSMKTSEGLVLADNDGRIESRTGWIVTDKYGHGLQRYFLEKTARGFSRAVTGFFQEDLGKFKRAWFYGDEGKGYVLRGKNAVSGKGMLVSDNEGVLIESYANGKAGFFTTNAFDKSSQKYYLKVVDGRLYVQTGMIKTSDGKSYFGLTDLGYIARGRVKHGNGMIVAAGDGALFFQDAAANSFVVTDKIDGGFQRYYIVVLDGGVKGAKLGLFKVGSDQYYGREDKGYVVRGTYTTPDGRYFRADNDGKLSFSFLTKAGWNAWDRLVKRGEESRTQYLIIVDNVNHRTVVFQGEKVVSGFFGNWTPLFDWACSTGAKKYHNGEGTPHGIYRIGGNADYNWEEDGNYKPGGYRTTYWTKNDVKYFTGFLLNLGFHSTVGKDGGYSDGRQLGKSITHGCIRLAEDAAKWIYSNALPGTKVWVY